MFSRRRLLKSLAALAAALASRASWGRGDEAVSEDGPPAIDGSINLAIRYLLERQDQDGAWRSDVYGPFRGGDALTPLVLNALLEAGSRAKTNTACQRAARWITSLLDAEGQVAGPSGGLVYPVYTAALTVQNIEQSAETRLSSARETWLQFLRERQLAEELGWSETDPAYGGWGYASEPPHRPPPDQPLSPLAEPNLSATVFALDALRAAGCSDMDPAVRKALTFVCRCQNCAEESHRRDPAYDDGGFFLMQNDFVRNKAGIAGEDRHGKPRFASYGSATADGLRCLLACGLPNDHPRVTVALGWLMSRFQPERHPGQYAADREYARSAVYYYYCRSLARAFRLVDACATRFGGERVSWPEALAAELIHRQRKDGAWSNPTVDLREDDPLVATPFAISALADCRKALVALVRE